LAFLAMAHHRLGHQDDAKRWLDKLIASQINAAPGSSWDDMETRILRREAEALILGSLPPAHPPTASEPTKKAAGDPGAKPE
jgi:hypothetical protein